ncbi:F-box/LRR-repeat protein 13-like [Gossypium australe]|uniref:F-box/LRR-repeat protein 13-like n=1 Tax=Gossypium australe TaxID=47621 RepID=A0A5B6US05_9ROSI|nr:F-box/LRR-repeat protein 13-like [Gossypium australe]
MILGGLRKSKVITHSGFSATLSTRKEVESGRDISQHAKLISERQEVSLPSNTETTLKEQVHAITIRSVKGLVEP